MRKFLFVSCLTAAFVACYQQTSYAEEAKQEQAQSSVAEPQNVLQLVDKTLDKMTTSVTTVVTTLSDAVKQVAPEVWRIMIRQQYAIALSFLLPLLLVIAALFYARKKLTDWKKTHECYHDCACLMPVVAWWVVAAIILIIVYTSVVDNIPRVINPEYFAIKELVSFVK